MKILHTFWQTLQKNKALSLIIVISVLVFSPALTTFFLGDDWFHLSLVQISSWQEFLNFFNPSPNPQSTAFYRPIPNHLFFFVFKSIFGLQPLFYHLALMLLFVVSLILFYRVVFSYTDKKTALIATCVFAFSHTHFSRLYFLSAGQEVFMNVFFLLALLKNKTATNFKDYFVIAIFFILGLLSKENILILPPLILILDWVTQKKIDLKKLLTLGIISLVYLYVRVFIVGFAMTSDSTESYQLNFSPRLALNTLYFYSAWVVGGAELLQDYLSSFISLIPRFKTDFGWLGQTMVGLSVATAVATGVLVIKELKKNLPLLILFAITFMLALLPVLFLPTHKFTIQMSIGVMCFAVFVAKLLKNQPRWVIYSFISLFILTNLSSISLTARSHYTVQRAEISKKVFTYFKENYPEAPKDSYFIFMDSNTEGSEIVTWGSSKQISHALMKENFFKVFYPNQNIEIYYEDDKPEIKTAKKRIELQSEWFL